MERMSRGFWGNVSSVISGSSATLSAADGFMPEVYCSSPPLFTPDFVVLFLRGKEEIGSIG
ncbi:hypothetical protein [Myxacorys almedinensis]|uniref:Uncharacterized protein n=1 Tax=Myxacorys almedinensis A TaxID=2690445 RepID=A0A8J8CJA1_9CYAN|nr:hypothetical protein [Myxacorys almedinensis]NDJ17391.1 hypothetical protein [Myxacorys almedinensis A]